MVLLQIWVKNMEKKDIRKQIFAARKAAEEDDIEKQSGILCDRVMALPQFQEAECIYVYMDYNKEASTRRILERAWKLGKRVAAPKVFGEDMRFFYIQSYEDVEPGYFGIPEPSMDRGLPEAQEEDALLLVPGVAFDAKCHRCGYGKGFYDRYQQRHPKHPTVAMALDFQIVESVPADSFDICPQILMTPTAMYRPYEKKVCSDITETGRD